MRLYSSKVFPRERKMIPSKIPKSKRRLCHRWHAWHRRWVTFVPEALSGVQMYAAPKAGWV